MATKKDSTPVLNAEPEEKTEAAPEGGKLEELQRKYEALQKENEMLKKNSIGNKSPYGGKSDYERVQDACREAAEAGLDPWKETISIRAPRRPAKEDPFYWLAINGRTMQVPANDKYFELSLPFAECLVNMIHAEYRAADYIESVENYDPVTNPKRD